MTSPLAIPVEHPAVLLADATHSDDNVLWRPVLQTTISHPVGMASDVDAVEAAAAVEALADWSP